MTNQLVVAPRAEADIREAFLWYEQFSSELAIDFLTRIENQLDRIQQSPQLFRLRNQLHRMAPTTRFPYVIYFIWDEKHRVVSVRRVLHYKQDAPTSG